MTTKYVYLATVISVTEKFQDLPVVQDANKQWSVPKESLGWYIRISASAAISVGDEKPDLVPGDQIQITIEKVITA